MSRAVTNPKRKKGRVGGGESGGVYDTQKFHNNECELFIQHNKPSTRAKFLRFSFEFLSTMGQKKKGFVFYWTTKKYSTTLKLRW